MNGKWYYEYPTDCSAIIKRNNTNYINTDDGQIPIQLYVVSQRTGIADNFWTSNDRRSLRSRAEPFSAADIVEIIQ